MKRGRYESRKKPFPFLKITLLTALPVLVLVCFCFLMQNPSQTGSEKLPSETKLENKTAIPGYESLTLKAGEKKQDTVLYNPPENTCLFRISLLLEDGTLLWTSREIKPGKDSDPIKLSQTLAVGQYPNAVLRYECFAMDAAKTPLNGAEIKLTLRVK